MTMYKFIITIAVYFVIIYESRAAPCLLSEVNHKHLYLLQVCVRMTGAFL